MDIKDARRMVDEHVSIMLSEGLFSDRIEALNWVERDLHSMRPRLGVFDYSLGVSAARVLRREAIVAGLKRKPRR